MGGEGAKGVTVEAARIWGEEGARARARAAQGGSVAPVTAPETAEDRAKGASGRILRLGNPAALIRMGGQRMATGAIPTGQMSGCSG